FEAGSLAIQCVQRGLRAVELVEVAHQGMNAGMKRLFQEMPIERMVVPPFALLRKLGAHEQKFLARMAEHEAVVGAQVGESLPGVPGHPRQERALTVDDLVVGQRQNEIFEEGVVQPEQDLAVMMAAVKRVL